ncbi:hypothetical protein [Paenibacillus thermotolerans]|uniref:hypothetical protein n=1 Tax=Paenibacillus thermotolerans TaxID=3027807 RepID=UPI002367A6B1|nr:MULTISPECIES: hypothetical protein [unclassified Paenibacillus]
MFNAKRLAAVIVPVIACASVLYGWVSQNTSMERPYFIWMFAAVMIGIVLYKGKHK